MASKHSTNSSSSSSQSKRNVNSQRDNLMIDVEFNRPSTSSAVNSFGGSSSSAPTSLVPMVSPMVAPTPAVPAVTLPGMNAAGGDQLTPEMEAIVFKFMEVTKMNRAFTIKCLKENAFNGDAAYGVFQQLQAINMIPPEAFIH